MFEKATKLKLRFTHNGIATVEDLWDMSLPTLDKIYKGLKAEAKKDEGESLLETKTAADDVLDLKIEIVKHIFTIKNNEKIARQVEADNRAFNKRLDSLIAQKQDEQMGAMSVEELMRLRK